MEDGDRIAVTSLPSGRVKVLDVAGISPHYVPTGSTVYVRGTASTHLVLVDSAGVAQPLPVPLEVYGSPRFSPNGRRVAFASTREGPYRLYSVPVDGTGADIRLVNSVDPVVEGIWTPDGHTLVYRAGGTGDLWYRRLEGDTSARSIVVSPWAERMPALSRDGGTQPAWAPNGRALFYRRGDQVVRADLEAGLGVVVASRRVLFGGDFDQGTGLHANYDVHPDGQRFVMIAPAGDQPQLVVVFGWFEELRRRMAKGR